MPSNVTNITSIHSFYDMALYASHSTNELFWGIILMAIFFIIMMNTRQYGYDRAIASASFSCLILSVIFLNIGFLQLVWPIAFAVSLAGTLFYIRFVQGS